MTSGGSGALASARKVRIAGDHAGQRIDNFLMRELKGVPRALVYRVIRRGEVRVNGGRIKPDYKLAAGDEVRVPPVRTAPVKPAARADSGLARLLAGCVLFEDRDLLVLDKPAGVAVHGGSGESVGVIEALRASRAEGAALELAHRLDKATSGCLVVAKRRPALRRLHEQMRRGELGKHYVALLRGRWPQDLRNVRAPLKRNVMRSGERVVRVDEAGKDAHTQVFVRTSSEVASFVHVRLLTGRTHQIRVHTAHSGHPVAGDPKYGDETFNARMQRLGLNRMFLHASQLEIGDRTVTAPLPDDLESLLHRLNLDA